jgi:hypothetical protein
MSIPFNKGIVSVGSSVAALVPTSCKQLRSLRCRLRRRTDLTREVCLINPFVAVAAAVALAPTSRSAKLDTLGMWYRTTDDADNEFETGTAEPGGSERLFDGTRWESATRSPFCSPSSSSSKDFVEDWPPAVDRVGAESSSGRGGAMVMFAAMNDPLREAAQALGASGNESIVSKKPPSIALEFQGMGVCEKGRLDAAIGVLAPRRPWNSGSGIVLGILAGRCFDRE